MNCSRKGCPHEAKWQLGFRAYARDHPRSKRTMIETFMSLAVCEEHMNTMTIADIVTPQGAEVLNNTMIRSGRAPLAMEEAEPIFHELIDGKLYMGPKSPVKS